jgi:hypothetical protein
MEREGLRLLIQDILLEYDVAPNATLYHRSDVKFKVGDVLTAQKDPKTGEHWLASRRAEKDLEAYRKKNHPDLPSRFNCIYASFSPRSRFLGKGRLYAIEPIGKTFVADSKIIDQMAINDADGYGSYSEIEEYWAGVEPSRHNIMNAEVLMDSARVVEVIDEQQRMMRGTVLRFGPQAPLLAGYVTVWGSESPNPVMFASDGSTKVPLEDALERLKAPGIDAGAQKGDKIPVTVGPGFEGFIVYYGGAEPRKTWGAPRIALATGTQRGPEGLYIQIEDNKALIKAFRQGKIEKLG